MAEKYTDDKDWGKQRASHLVENLFFKDDDLDSSYLALQTMQSLHIYISHIKGGLRALHTAAQALWDKDLIACVDESNQDIMQMEEWALQQLAIKAPQSLIVPVLVENDKM